MATCCCIPLKYILCICAQSHRTVCDFMDCSPSGSSVHGIFSRQEYWRGLLVPPPVDLPDPGIEPVSPVTPTLPGGFFSTESPGLPSIYLTHPEIYLTDIQTQPLRQRSVSPSRDEENRWNQSSHLWLARPAHTHLGISSSGAASDSSCRADGRRPGGWRVWSSPSSTATLMPI